MPPSPDQLEHFRASHRLPGLVLSTFSADSIDTLALGEAEVSTRFPIASVTKTFTADLVLELAEANMLDRPIRETLPDFALADPDAAARLTPRDALCHFSGLPPHTWAWVYGDRPRADFIRERLPHLSGTGSFRGKHRYSNLLYAVLGHWIESVSGHSWETRLQQVISGPMHLKSTDFLDENWADSAPTPYERTVDGIQKRPPFFAKKNHLIAPASELIAPVPDLAVWGQHHLRLSPSDLRWQPHNLVDTQRPHPSMGPLHYGLGWRVDTVCGEPRVWHSGQCGGYSTLLVLYPERKIGFAAATNLHASVLPLQAMDLWIHHCIAPEWLEPEISEVRGQRSEVRETQFPNSPFSQFPNPPIPTIYSNPGYGDLELLLKDGRPHSRFQNSPPVPIQFPQKFPHLALPGYSVSFPIIQPNAHSIAMPFEPECEDILFVQRSMR